MLHNQCQSPTYLSSARIVAHALAMPFATHQDTGNQYRHVEDEPESERFLEYQQSSVHLATVEEKKRLWWRNALITGACIALW